MFERPPLARVQRAARPQLRMERLLALPWPPPPHDPRQRERLIALHSWEVRLFTDVRFRYFVPRGLWHVQLWHEEARVSVLTRSGLTKGAYEVFPIQEWKQRVNTYEALRQLVETNHQVAFLSEQELAWIEKRFVKDIVRGKSTGFRGKD